MTDQKNPEGWKITLIPNRATLLGIVVSVGAGIVELHYDREGLSEILPLLKINLEVCKLKVRQFNMCTFGGLQKK